MKFWKKAEDFYSKYYCEIFMLLMFLFLGLYEFYYAYYVNFYISPDSSGYLRAAMSILRGDGFRYLQVAGNDAWFSSWPIGYPALIALTSLLCGRNIYLSSKLLGAILAGLGLIVLYLRFRKDSWLYSLAYLNAGFLIIYSYTWSENPFILFLLIFTVALSEIITNEAPKRYWYLFLGIGGVGAFLARYFGLVTIIMTGIVICGYLVYGFYQRKKKQPCQPVKRKTISLVITGAVMGTLMGGYLVMNKIMAGYMSGVDRTRIWDDYRVLTDNLFSALKEEVFYATNLSMIAPIQNLKFYWNLAFDILMLSLMIYLIYKLVRKKLDYKVVFIVAGVAYYAIFIFVRYHSSMNGFGYRFFAPGSFLVSIGVIGVIQEWIGPYKKRICLAGTLFLALCCAFMLRMVVSFDKNAGAWAKYNSNISQELEEVPGKSVVLKYNKDTDIYTPTVVRPDLSFYCVNESSNMDAILDSYASLDYIYAKAAMAKDIMANPDNYDPSMQEFFEDAVSEDTPDNEWIAISPKERKIVSAP